MSVETVNQTASVDAKVAEMFPAEWAVVANEIGAKYAKRRAKLRDRARRQLILERMKAVYGEEVVMSWKGRKCPLEMRVETALTEAGIEFVRHDTKNTHLDFHLPAFNIHIEVKRWGTPRTEKQIERATDVIVLQGGAAVAFLERLLKPCAAASP